MHKEWNLAPRSLVDLGLTTLRATNKSSGAGGGVNGTQTFVSGALGPAATVTFTAAPYTPFTSGSALILGLAQNVIVSNAGDGMVGQVLNNGVASGTGYGAAIGGTTGGVIAMGVVPITKGVAFTPGMTVANNNNTHTVQVPANTLDVIVIELQTH